MHTVFDSGVGCRKLTWSSLVHAAAGERTLPRPGRPPQGDRPRRRRLPALRRLVRPRRTHALAPASAPHTPERTARHPRLVRGRWRPRLTCAAGRLHERLARRAQSAAAVTISAAAAPRVEPARA